MGIVNPLILDDALKEEREFNPATDELPGAGISALERDYIESLTVETTMSTVFATILTLNTAVLIGGNYRIDWSFLWHTDNSAKELEINILVDSVIVWQFKGASSNAANLLSATSFIVTNLSNAAHTIEIEFRKEPNPPNNAVTVEDRRIAIERWT